MKIKEIELSEIEKKFIYDQLIELFDPQFAASHAKGHEINFSLNDRIEVWSTLDLNVEYSEFDTNHQCTATDVSVKFSINIYNMGDTVKGIECWNIEDQIKSYNWIKYF